MLPVSYDAYIRHGWALVPIPTGTKGPRQSGWNKKENCLVSSASIPDGYGVGLAHAYSGTMSLDIDEWDTAEALLSEHGINLINLMDAPDAVTIESGVSGHGKLIYAMPFGLTLPSKKISANRKVSYELRCATSSGLTVQDVLPPSIHPVTQQPYQWGGRGNWQRLPTIPHDLLMMWYSIIERDNSKVITEKGEIDTSWVDIRSALYTIPPDIGRDEWVQIGMALHHAGITTEQPDQAQTLWDEWSSTGQKYKGQQDTATQWRSFKPGEVKLGTLFHLAADHGWRRPAPDVTDLFSAVKPSAPLSIIDGLRAPVPRMDMTLWPEVLATRATELSYQIGCDPLVPLMAGLGAVCAAVDSRSRLELMPGYHVPPVLWLMTIGAPADKKTPASKPMMTILGDLEKEDMQRFKQDLLKWEAQEAMYASSKKAYLDAAKAPEMMIDGGKVNVNNLPQVACDPPAKPVPLRLTVTDITSQKLIHHAADRPEGLLCYLDEMNSWVHKLSDPKSGEDRSAWTVSYESNRYTMDRVGAGTITCENLAVSIYGNIQPRVLRHNLAALSVDGLIQRFIPAVLSGEYDAVPNHVPDLFTNKPRWEQLIRQVRSLPPTCYRLDDGAYKVFREFQEWYHRAKQDERILLAEDTFMTAFGKLEGTTGRLILIHHIMGDPYNPTVSADTVTKCCEVTKSYIIPALRYTYADIGGVADKGLDNWMIEYLVRIAGDQDILTMRDIKRASKRRTDGMTMMEQESQIRDTMALMEKEGWVVMVEDNKRSTSWAINPTVKTLDSEYRTCVIKAKQRQADERRAIVIRAGSHTPRTFVKGYTPDMDE